ncbi:MAG: hypothetical protein DRR19_08990 [Candidatus Parabeggiatoa sp. nov. 1]|nr:MAG: hypothetical protein DRR19_08990 [Gammaproteobacteria bacterium]
MRIDLKRFTISALVCTFVGNVQAADIVGQIDYFNCVPDVYSLTRDGKKMAVKFFSLLREGDQVAINTDKNTLSLELSYEDTIAVHHQTQPYTAIALPLSVKVAEAACPPDDAYSFKRDGKMLPIQPTLLVGDQIVVNNATPTIHLKLGDNKVEEVNHKNSPYTVKSTGKVSSTSSNLWAWVKQVVTDWHEEELQTTVAIVNTRGVGDTSPDIPTPYIDLLEEPRELVAGTRTLHLAWKGGEKPYELILQQEGRPILSEAFQEQRITTPPLKLTPGEYQLRLSDKQQRTVDYTFTVVGSKPGYPSELLDSNIPKDTRLTAQALWLAAQEEGQWSFEAYQQLAKIAEHYPPARISRDALEQLAPIEQPE